MKHSRTPLLGLIALGASMALAPAFAQDAASQDTMGQDAATQSTYQDAADVATQAPPPGALPAGESQQVTWADIDVDQSGTISREESARLPSLAQVFDEADADGDGQLTPDEYKAFAAAAQPPADGAGSVD